MSMMRKLALLALLVPQLAHADAKYKRQQDVKVDVKLSDRVKPISTQPKGTSEVKPELSADQVLNVEGLVGNIRAEQEQILVDLIAQTPDSEVEEKSDYYFRLGELFAKQQRYWRLKAAEAAIAVDKEKNPGKKAQLQAAANKANESAKNYLLKAVKTYKSLTDNPAFRNYPKMDMALFYYGFTLQGGKYMKEARAVYDQLLKNYPNSKYVPEAHLAFGDYFFENNQLDDAEARYKQVLKFPKSSVYWYAMYKMGWIDLNKQRFQDALETFFQVAQATKTDKKQEVLNRASKKDFVRAYAEIGKADKAFDAFKRVDANYAFEMEMLLADFYMEQGKSDKGIYIFRDLMKRAPTNKNVCLWQYNVAHLMLSMPGAGNADKVAEIENLNHLWGALKAKQVLPAAEKQECHDNAAAMSGELARAYHSESAKTKNPETLAYAEKLYKVYLEVFPDAEDYAQTQYFYAELLWSRAENEKNPRLQTELWETAAVAFTDVVKTGKVDAKLMKESAYAAVLGWKNALNVDPRNKEKVEIDEKQDKNAKEEKIPAAQPIPEREMKMVAAFDIYIGYIKDPKDDELVGMKFLKANIYRRYNHFDEAIPLFEEIIDKHPEHETAEYAANLLLDTYNRLHRYEDLLKLADKLAANKKFLENRDDLKATVLKIQQVASRKAAEEAERKIRARIAELKGSKDYGMLVECGNMYLDIYNKNPEAADNDEVLYNAGVCFQDGRSIGAAILTFGKLEKYYPKSKITQKAIARLGKAYADIAFYDRASDKYEQYAKAYAGEKDAYDVMSDAVFFRKGIGDDDKAIADTKYFVDTFGRKKPAEAAGAAFSLVSIYEKRGDNEAVLKHLREYLHVWGDKGGIDKVVIAHAKIGNILWHQSCPVKEVDGACVKITRERAIASKKIVKKKGKEVYVAPKQCGAESKIKLQVVARNNKKGEALSEFKQAAQAFARMKEDKDNAGFGGARYWYALGKFAEADVEYEKYLDLKFPAGLNFGDGLPEHKAQNEAVSKKSKARFDDWIKAKTKGAETANNKYGEVLAIKDNSNSIAAAAREGQITQNFSDALFTAEIPEEVRRTQMIEGYDIAQDKVDNYCDALTTAAEPLADKSLAAYGTCLSKSTELGWFSDWSKMCEHELGQIKPEQFPTASELHGTADNVQPITAPEPPAKLE
jgi:outer membrane protein assembly factor BamD (BamD/ComL family)